MGSVTRERVLLDTLFSDTTTTLKLVMAPAVPFVWETVATATVQGMWVNLNTNLTGAHGAFHTLVGLPFVCQLG